MKAVRLHQYGVTNIQVDEMMQPAINSHDVLIKILAASINYRDLVLAQGMFPSPIGLPFIPLSDACGEVVEIGSKVTRFKVGDIVCPSFIQDWMGGEPVPSEYASSLAMERQGVLAEYSAHPEKSLVRAPSNLSPIESASLPCAAVTAWSAVVTEGQVKPGQTIVTLGTGGVSIFALQIAKAAGAYVIATTSSAAKMERLKTLGADLTINYNDQPDWDKNILEITNGRGADLIVDTVGGDSFSKELNAVRFGGRISLVGMLGGFTTTFSPPIVSSKRIRLLPVSVGSVNDFEELVKAVEQHSIKPVIDKVFGFHDLDKALAYLQEGKHFGKICLEL